MHFRVSQSYGRYRRLFYWTNLQSDKNIRIRGSGPQKLVKQYLHSFTAKLIININFENTVGSFQRLKRVQIKL